MKLAPIIRHVSHKGIAGYAIDRIPVTDLAFPRRDPADHDGRPDGGL
jgi:hypothetical protein